eukprot:g27168.t1
MMVVVVRGQSSQLQDISVGVPQGSILGLTMFSCFIDNDYTMFSTIHNDSDTEAVHVQIQTRSGHCNEKCQVTFALHNCQTMTMTIFNKRQSNQHPLTFNDITITASPTTNILGATINQIKNWIIHINNGYKSKEEAWNPTAKNSPLDSQSQFTIYMTQIRRKESGIFLTCI